MTTTQTPPKPRDERMRTKALIMFRAFGIDRDSRLELTRQILHLDDHQCQSFNDLDEAQLARVLDAMTGATLVAHLCLDRRAGRPPCPTCGRR
jgi:hypothetical protein